MRSRWRVFGFLLLASSCRAGGAGGARGNDRPPPEVSHKSGPLRCPLAAQGPEFQWAEDARASELRRTAVQALLRDSIEREKGAFARPSRWCVFTRVTGWAVCPASSRRGTTRSQAHEPSHAPGTSTK